MNPNRLRVARLKRRQPVEPMPPRITSRKNAEMKKLRKLKRKSCRDQLSLFLVEGFKLLKEAAARGARFDCLVYTADRSDEATLIRGMAGGAIREYEVSEDLMCWMSDVVTSQGILGAVEQADRSLEEINDSGASFILVADRVRDPGNLGALLRVADAAGLDYVILSSGCVDLYNPKVVRSGAGAHFHLPIASEVDFQDAVSILRGRGVNTIGLDSAGEFNYLDIDWTEPVALVVGNEANGIPEPDRELLDGRARIQMPGSAESLNVAAAASAVVFEALRQREGG